MLGLWLTALLLGSFCVLKVDAIQTISAVGSKFFFEDGTQYFIKGVAYQLVPDDPLIDTAQCRRDIALMAQLGANAIRVYHVDPHANHDGCMKAFAEAGIYLFVDLDTFDTSIKQASHPDTPYWTQSQLDRYTAVLDEFQKYNNTAGFFIGNEVLNSQEGSAAAPYVLAAAHDVKQYRDEQGYRNIPVGYAAADIAELRPMLQNYLACRPDPAERLDFFALNAYEWCGPSSYRQSGYAQLQEYAKDYPIPIFFSETGCNAARPRTFEDQAAIFGPEMSDTWSGSIIYEWIEEANDYGLISYDFDNLKEQWDKVSPTGVALSEYAQSVPAITPPVCPTPTAGGWAVDPNAPLPTLG
ncbi:1,3-beta-glucanosyltransferase [Aspergillus ochraceoroseus]|uniref:1,3-beta-glucanosyltransferase n=1 Tax=Aspergillus ochraceoroseus TaxID=138278 RepID=A0A0F8U0R5_9EURO|nr:1,3-beta-glucanosyltransferase [Aspergillus ochraceoroseus]